MKAIKLRDDSEFLKLDQLLKLGDVAQSGGHAKDIIGDGLVKVNGEIETRRGKKLYPGDKIEVFDFKFIIE